jgi:hypothetical protein
MSSKNTNATFLGGPTDRITAGGFGTLDYRISAKDFAWAIQALREAERPAGTPSNAAGADSWPFDGVIARL